MELKIKKNGEWKNIPHGMMPLPPSGFTALIVEGSTCAYNVPYHSLSYSYADDR